MLTDLRQLLAERPIGGCVLKVALEIGDPLAQPLPLAAILCAFGEVAHAGVEIVTETFVAFVAARDADDPEIIRKQIATAQIVERGHQ